MKKSTKIWLLIALATAVSGLILLAVAFGSVDFRWTALAGELVPEVSERTERVSEPFSALTVEDSACDVTILPSSDNNCSIVVKSSEKIRHSVALENGTLRISCTDTRRWFEYLLPQIHHNSSVTVYLPEQIYTSISVNTMSGNVSVSGLTDASTSISLKTASGNISVSGAAGDLFLSTSSGDLRLKKLQAILLTASTASGDVEISGCSASVATLSTVSGEMELKALRFGSVLCSATSGDVEAQDLICTEAWFVETVSGDIELSRCDAPELSFRTTSGDVEGSILTGKTFRVDTTSGSVRVPKDSAGGSCEVDTTSGDVKLSVVSN